MWVKLCGNTRLEDCLLAAELGADAVGFVFAPGKRTVTAGQVAAITRHLPNSLEKVGVFTSHDAVAIASVVSSAGLTGVQVHGTYDAQLMRDLRKELGEGSGTRLVQVVHWRLDHSVEEQRDGFAAMLDQVQQDGLSDAMLVDTSIASQSGGTGKTFDWAAVAPVLGTAHLPVYVAGGLHPGNVGEAIATLRPAGVDVSSGVEQSPGVKDADKVRSFITNARAASEP